MRILVLENEPSSRRGGQELSLLDVCRGLAARGHEIELLYTVDGDLLAQYRSFSRRVDRVSAYAIDRARTIGSAADMIGDLVQAGRPAPDVIYANQYLDSFFGRLIAWRFRRPFVCHVRLTPPDVFCGQYAWGMAGPSRLIAISAQTRADYVERGFRADRIDVVHNGIAAREWQRRIPRRETLARLGVDAEALLVVFAGRLHPSKGIEVLIDAVARLPGDVHLLLAGREINDGRRQPYEPVLRKAAAALGRRCHFVGHYPDMAELFHAADVTVLPSVVSEAFGRIVIESMACGTPVVASRVGGIPEILTGEFERYLCPPGDAHALAECLSSLRGWRDHDPDLGARCRAHVERRFDIEQTVGGVEASLARTIAEWRAGALLPAAGSIVRSQEPCASA
jgi:glycosyltransferase involved in cell wall biosynthesis